MNKEIDEILLKLINNTLEEEDDEPKDVIPPGEGAECIICYREVWKNTIVKINEESHEICKTCL